MSNDYKPWVSVDDDGSVLVELRISPTKRFSIEVNPDGTHESCYVEDGKVRPITGPTASDAGLRAVLVELRAKSDSINHGIPYLDEVADRIEAALNGPAAAVCADCDSGAPDIPPHECTKYGKFEAAGDNDGNG